MAGRRILRDEITREFNDKAGAAGHEDRRREGRGVRVHAARRFDALRICLETFEQGVWISRAYQRLVPIGVSVLRRFRVHVVPELGDGVAGDIAEALYRIVRGRSWRRRRIGVQRASGGGFEINGGRTVQWT